MRKCINPAFDDNKLDWEVLSEFTPVDLRALSPVEAMEEVVKQIVTRFHRVNQYRLQVSTFTTRKPGNSLVMLVFEVYVSNVVSTVFESQQRTQTVLAFETWCPTFPNVVSCWVIVTRCHVAKRGGTPSRSSHAFATRLHLVLKEAVSLPGGTNYG